MPKNCDLEAKKLPNRPEKKFETHRKNRKKIFFWSKKIFFWCGQKNFSGRFEHFWASQSRFFGIFAYFSLFFVHFSSKMVKFHQKYLFWGTFGDTMVKISGNFLKKGKIGVWSQKSPKIDQKWPIFEISTSLHGGGLRSPKVEKIEKWQKSIFPDQSYQKPGLWVIWVIWYFGWSKNF